MHITHLSLTNFRNYRRLDLEMDAGPVVIQGDNAQGKTNLLESAHVLGTTRSHRSSNDRELVNCDAWNEDMPVARLSADVERSRGGVRLEVVFKGERVGSVVPVGDADPSCLAVRKQVRVNGVARRAADLLGQMNVVMFTAQDIELATGKSALCRRYLDLLNCQLDRAYLRSLQRYQKVLVQRNHLLRLLQEEQAQPNQLDFWDDELVESGSLLIVQRVRLVEALNGYAGEIHRRISGGREDLGVAYVPSCPAHADLPGIECGFREALQRKRRREVVQGVTLVGPHRDTLSFSVNGTDVTKFGSRGQQQTVVLSLKLAEAEHMQAEVGDCPVILLDDVFSELDVQRRKHLLDMVSQYQQVLITATDPGCFDPSFLADAARFRVSRGVVESA